ncbi:MAG: hypothetical protein E6J43_00370 [Chloroflexi bacterium]|nr:MAG: hypothetical protein E6J43_00370 [Chloroflexota bacterium]
MRIFLAAYLAAVVILGGLAIAGGLALYGNLGPDGAAEEAASEHGYNLAGWEINHFPEKWLHKLQHLFHGPSEQDRTDAICEYFQTAARLANSAPQPDAEAEKRLAELENDVEDAIEGRATAILEDQKLMLQPPLFSDLGLVFPPVDFEIDGTPRVLAISPRDRIELQNSYLLEPDIPLQEIDQIEHDAESANVDGHGVSALIIRTGGFSSYPSVVFADAPYDSLMETVFHEWLHSYLIFFPLGEGYFRSAETRTLNESVANMGGKELARLYFERYGTLDQACGAQPRPSVTPAPVPTGFDFTSEMRALRRQVEAMLAQGQVEGAEALMAAKRDEFQTKGVFIRRLNQAYFAFHGFYADSPGSIDPVGPKLQTLLERAGSPGEFVRRASAVTTRADLDKLLE